jgi:hypothetical protein
MLKNLEIVEKAGELWPKASPAELGLLEKVFSDIDGQKAISILEDARIACRYQTIPFPDLKRRVTGCGSAGALNGYYTDCWAVHNQTAKFKFCAVLAQNSEGAKVQMEKYIGHYLKLELSEYVIFVGNTDKTKLALDDYRMKILGTR